MLRVKEHFCHSLEPLVSAPLYQNSGLAVSPGLALLTLLGLPPMTSCRPCLLSPGAVKGQRGVSGR